MLLSVIVDICSNAFDLTITAALMMWRKTCCYSARMHRPTMSKDHWWVLLSDVYHNVCGLMQGIFTDMCLILAFGIACHNQ